MTPLEPIPRIGSLSKGCGFGVDGCAGAAGAALGAAGASGVGVGVEEGSEVGAERCRTFTGSILVPGPKLGVPSAFVGRLASTHFLAASRPSL